ncbi:MAG: DUF5591 domain-containing protein [Candidatus Thermoplasmatota archaeon]
MIEITDRWGLAKRGKWSIKEQEIVLPNVFFLEGNLFDPPDEAEVTISTESNSTFQTPSSFFEETSDENDLPSTFAYPDGLLNGLIEERGGKGKIQVIFDQDPDLEAELYVLGNAPQLLQRSGKLYDKITELRKKIDYHKLVYAPGIAQPNNMALLAYLGVDLFDSSFLEMMSFEGVELSDWIGFPGNTESNSRHLLDELELIRKGIIRGRIRELVESRIRSGPWMVEVLRKCDDDYEIFSRGLPVTGDNFSVTTRESLDRPDIERFKKRIKERYEPPNRDILLLLPCSARKPYFQSRTHKRFREATRDVNWTDIHEVSLTSPLGVVPRELELFYPAQQYDIPVTHKWFEEEKNIILDQLQPIIDKGDYDHIISHLPPDMSFVGEEIECIDSAKDTHPTSSQAIDRLAETLSRMVGEERGSVQEFLRENLESFARFQFGEGGEKLLESSKIKGKYPWYKIMEGETQRGMLVPERGLISLTLDGAKVLKKIGINLVEIDDFVPKGSVFAVGVRGADEDIRPEDEAVVVHEGELRGVGPSVMFGEEMKEAKKGEAVRLRHHL